jgi:hypothetical protein
VNSTFQMGPRSSRIIEVLSETIQRAEQTPELGPSDPGVVELRRILSQWIAQNGLLLKDGIALTKGRGDAVETSDNYL